MTTPQRPVEEIAKRLYDASIVKVRTGVEYDSLPDSIQYEWIGIATEAERLVQAERQSADKLRQENEALKKNRCETCGANIYSGPPDCPGLLRENEALRAQVSGLVGALRFYTRGNHDAGRAAQEALSTLPSTFLEIQKAKDAVIEAALQFSELREIHKKGRF